MHGGLSTGPRTKEGKDRIRATHLRHGEETLEAKAEDSAKSVMFRYLTDIGNHCNMFHRQVKTRGRPPTGVYAARPNRPRTISSCNTENSTK